jgi:CDP-paratose 2-epimerase
LKILITGVCGFVGSNVARALLSHRPDWQIFGVDNFIRPGSELSREDLRRRGVTLAHCDMRAPSDVDSMAPVDWLIDAAANPSVLGGVDGRSSSRQVVEHNLLGTVNMLEYCRRNSAGFVLLSTSRVYSVATLATLPVEPDGIRYALANTALPQGVSARGLDESVSVAPPLSLYGATKLASEVLALEYGESFGLPVWINRCGVLAGAGQFGRPDQGILAYWLNAYLRRQPLAYIGFQGTGYQTRDAFHPADLADLLIKQIEAPRARQPKVVNVGGGAANSFSLAEVSAWCAQRFGFEHPIKADMTPRLFDVPVAGDG